MKMIKDILISLKMHGALEALEGVEKIKNRNMYASALLQAEYEWKRNRSVQRKLAKAKFPVEKEWCDIDRDLNPTIDFSRIQALSNTDFVKKSSNVCLIGQQGTGKTHSLIALGRELCRKGQSVRFYTACELVNQLEEAKSSHSLSKLMEALRKPQLLIIDELGFVPFSENGARLLFDVFASRYERGSIAVSTNLTFDKWGQVFGSIELTAALIDRFIHNCLILTFEGNSVRLMRASGKN